MDDIIVRLEPIFRDVFDQPELSISRESSAKTVEGWDSLTHVTLVMAVEQEFKVKFGLGELQDLENVGGMVDLIRRKTS
jgi:acyl carrier protein